LIIFLPLGGSATWLDYLLGLGVWYSRFAGSPPLGAADRSEAELGSGVPEDITDDSPLTGGSSGRTRPLSQ
jgi:hypothetical protein